MRAKPHHEALLVTGETEGEQQSTRAGVEEKMAHLASQTNQLMSFIDQVEKGVGTALLQLESLSEATNSSKPAPVDAKKSEAKPGNATKAAAVPSHKTETKPPNATNGTPTNHFLNILSAST